MKHFRSLPKVSTSLASVLTYLVLLLSLNNLPILSNGGQFLQKLLYTYPKIWHHLWMSPRWHYQCVWSKGHFFYWYTLIIINYPLLFIVLSLWQKILGIWWWKVWFCFQIISYVFFGFFWCFLVTTKLFKSFCWE